MTDRTRSDRGGWATGPDDDPGFGYDDRGRPGYDDRGGSGYDPGYGSDDAGYDDRNGGRGISAGLVFLVIALIGSVGFALYAIQVRDASQIPLLAAGAAVLGIVFGALAVFTARATWRAGIAARGAQALLLGIGGGIAAMIAAGCLAGAIILFLLSQGGPS